MADDKDQKVETPETPEVKASETPETSQISDDQRTSLKEEISKDVAGQVSEQVSKSVIERIAGAFGLNKKEEEDLSKKSPEDLKKLVSEMAKKEAQGAVEEYKTQTQKEQEESEKEREARIDNVVTTWYSQYNHLASQGKVPKIASADPKDSGMQARRSIIIEIGKQIEYLKQQGSSYIPTVADILILKPNLLTGPPGDDLPISGNTQLQNETANFKYSDIRGKSMDQIARESTLN